MVKWKYSFTILDLGTRWRLVVTFTFRPLKPQGKSPSCPLERRLGGCRRQSGRCGVDKNLLSLPGIRPGQYNPHPVAIPTEIPLLPAWFNLQVFISNQWLLSNLLLGEDCSFRSWYSHSPRSLPSSQKPTTKLYPEPFHSSLHLTSVRTDFISTYLHLIFQSVNSLFPSGFPIYCINFSYSPFVLYVSPTTLSTSIICGINYEAPHYIVFSSSCIFTSL
jgi:hypothetical protein